MSRAANRTGVIPASLSFLTIYNPNLSINDENLHEQIVYYYSGSGEARESHSDLGNVQSENSREELNERLRQIGLAQGMIEFAKSFSNGNAVDSVETAKCRILLHELEAGWWILASINLTRILNSAGTPRNTTESSDVESNVEYSVREVCPPALLLQQLLRAHQVFLLHHSPTLADLYARLARPKFCRILKRYWDNYVLDWDLLLNGNPAVDVFNGLKLAAGGELGIGVGEEEWGSGEREVLEDFVRRTDGLVDLVVSRFGDAVEDERTFRSQPLPPSFPSIKEKIVDGWHGGGQHPRPSDGVVFSGIGAITRYSVRDVSSWVELLYKHGQRAYGVQDNPSAARWRRRDKPLSSSINESNIKATPISQPKNPPIGESSKMVTTNVLRKGSVSPPQIPAPVVRPSTLSAKTVNAQSTPDHSSLNEIHHRKALAAENSPGGTDTLMKYLTLGIYGSAWGIPSRNTAVQERKSSIRKGGQSNADSRRADSNFPYLQEHSPPHGHFLIGLQGELEQDVDVASDGGETETSANHGRLADNRVPKERGPNERTMLRTLQVQRPKQKSISPNTVVEKAEDEPSSEIKHERLRVVVYVASMRMQHRVSSLTKFQQRPFIFTFLFELQTDSLAMPTFYHSIHHQLGPLQRPLLASTSPRKVFERLWEASAPKSTSSMTNTEPIWDLVYDPMNLTVHTTIPNIPNLGTATVGDPGPETVAVPWTRAEALSVHSQILNTYSATRRYSLDVERTCKTSRGWWVVWMRLAPTRDPDGLERGEAFLIRKASDYTGPAARTPRGLFGRDVGGSNASSGWGPAKLAEGIGIDARQYIEGLLSLNR